MTVKIIYKLVTRCEWEAAQAAGVYRGSAHDLRDGFIHFSTAQQLGDTARKYFSGVSDLVLLAVDAEASQCASAPEQSPPSLQPSPQGEREIRNQSALRVERKLKNQLPPRAERESKNQPLLRAERELKNQPSPHTEWELKSQPLPRGESELKSESTSHAERGLKNRSSPHAESKLASQPLLRGEMKLRSRPSPRGEEEQKSQPSSSGETVQRRPFSPRGEGQDEGGLRLHNLRWEPSRGGDLFPHLYADLPLSAVRIAIPVPLAGDGTPLLPSNLPS